MINTDINVYMINTDINVYMINTDRMENTFTWTKIRISTFLNFYSELFLLRFFMFVIYFCTWYGRFLYVNNLFNHVELYLMRHGFPFTVCLSHF